MSVEYEPGTTSRDDVIGLVVRQMLRNRDDLLADLSAAIRSRVGSLDLDPRLREQFEAGTADNFLAVLDYARNDAGADQVRAPERALVYARTLAQRDVPASTLIRAYRIGHAVFLDTAMRYAAEFGGVTSSAAIIRLVNRAGEYVDQVCEQVGIAYEQERDRWVGSRGGLRREWVARVLDGSITDIARAERMLGYPLRGSHIAVNAWLDTGRSVPDAVDIVDRVQHTLAAVFGARGRPLLVPVDEYEVRLWLAVPHNTAVEVGTLDREISERALPVRLAVGGYAAGVDGFRRTARRADRVRAIALLGDTARRVVSYEQVAALTLMTADIDALAEFVTEELGELAVNGPRTGWLRETLLVFLAVNRSYTAAAARLAVHRNTVQYRVQQALDLAGRGLGEHDDILHLQAALEAAHWIGAPVLRPAGDVSADDRH